MFPKRYWFVFLIYVLMLVMTAVVPVILYFGFGIDPLEVAIYSNVVGFIIGPILVLLLMRKDLSQEKIAHPISAGRIIGWTALGVLLAWNTQAIAATIEIEFFGIDPSSENTEVIVEMTRMNPIFLLIPAISAPILEELIFRKIIFGSLYKKFNFFWGALISSLIFGVLHMDLTHTLIYTTMGFVFAYLYVQSKRIIVPILVHMTLNTVTVLAQLLIDPEQLEQIQNNAMFIFFGG
ncbi:CPBP family intramembrane glutamic endopeptidase [Pseudogracilibacillus sp. SO30301A]|uniref:CPBP family intramembrane glutamic endopeptidase n=1 Tax=Pseudogracilibacillus sp. SO30301A TaxID=3098291 RepID=UPI00300E3B64